MCETPPNSRAVWSLRLQCGAHEMYVIACLIIAYDRMCASSAYCIALAPPLSTCVLTMTSELNAAMDATDPLSQRRLEVTRPCAQILP